MEKPRNERHANTSKRAQAWYRWRMSTRRSFSWNWLLEVSEDLLSWFGDNRRSGYKQSKLAKPLASLRQALIIPYDPLSSNSILTDKLNNLMYLIETTEESVMQRIARKKAFVRSSGLASSNELVIPSRFSLLESVQRYAWKLTTMSSWNTPQKGKWKFLESPSIHPSAIAWFYLFTIGGTSKSSKIYYISFEHWYYFSIASYRGKHTTDIRHMSFANYYGRCKNWEIIRRE